MAEDLEFNPFFKALQTRFLSLYERAQQNCWLVCLPAAVSLQTCLINKQFAEKHILEPSGLLRDVFGSVGIGKLSWRLDGNELLLNGSELQDLYKVKVLAEELAYNKSLKQFKMFIIDKPLDPNYKGPEGVEQRKAGSVLKDALDRKRTYKEHRDFLVSFPNYKEGLEELNRQIRLFKQNYLVVEVQSLLLDTASKLEGITRQANDAFVEANRYDTRLQDKRVMDACCLSLEGYLMHHVHSKVFPAVCGVHSKQDGEFAERCRMLHERGKMTPSAVGVSRDYECRYPSTLGHLRSLESQDTPLEILYCIQDAMDSIMADVKDHFVKSLRIGEPAPLPSDDLIALLATILIQVNFKHLLSTLYYTEHFHWLSDFDQLSYTLVTFRAAVEYLRGSEVLKWLPPRRPQQTKSQGSSPNFPLVAVSSNSRHGSSSPSHSLSTSEESSSSGSGHVSSLSKSLMAQLHMTECEGSGHVSSLSKSLMAQLRMTESEEKRHHKPHPQPQENSQDSGGLGPFLSRLLESDNVTSSDYYGN